VLGVGAGRGHRARHHRGLTFPYHPAANASALAAARRRGAAAVDEVYDAWDKLRARLEMARHSDVRECA
jgi:hypothetical protein